MSMNSKHPPLNTSSFSSLFRSAYSPKSRLSISFDPESSMTHQSFKDECDINVIMSRYMKTGVLPQNLTPKEAQYLDVSDVEFQAAANIVAGAKTLFEQMPSSIRNQFDNDPAKLLAFTSDPNNRLAAAEMGLLAPEKAAAILAPMEALKNAPTGSNPVSSETV